MAKVKQTITVRTRKKRVPEGSVVCNVCGGKGYHAKPKRKK